MSDDEIELPNDPMTLYGLLYRIAWIAGACFIAWLICG